MKQIYLVLLFLGCSLQVFAQHTYSIKGKVHKENGETVSHVTIKIEGTSLQVISDENGLYAFPNVPAGKYTVTVSSVEIQPKKLQINVNKNYPDLHIHISPKGDLALDEVQVLRNTVKREIETRGFAVNVIETKEAALQNIQTTELLDRSAGVKIRQDGGLGSSMVLNLNGLSGNAVKVFIDGVPISNYGRSFSLNSIPPALIEHIEVYKGVLPGHLSEDALGGAINIVLKKSVKNLLTTSYSFGSFNTHQLQANGSFQIKENLVLRASGFHNYSDNNYEVWGEDILYYDYMGKSIPADGRVKRFHDAYKSTGGKIEVGITNKKWADQLFLGGVFSNQMNELQHGVSMKMVYGNRHGRQNSQIATLNYRKQDLFVNGLSLDINSSVSFLERNNIDTVGDWFDWSGSPILKPDGSKVQYAKGSEQASIGKTYSINDETSFLVRSNLSYVITPLNTLHANILYNSFKRGVDDLKRDDLWRAFQNVRDLEKRIYSFTYENLSFGKKLRSNIFYKYYFQDILSYEPQRVSGEWVKKEVEKNVDYGGYGAAFSYTLGSNIVLLASGERAIRLPSEGELFGNDVENEDPNYNLEPERSFNLNLGFNIGPLKFAQNSFNLNASLFRRDVQGMIRRSFSSDSRDIASYENLQSVEARGFDAEFIYRYADKLLFNFTISQFNALFNTEFDERGARYTYYRQQIRNEPSFKFSGSLSYYVKNLIQKNSKVSFNYRYNYVNKFLRDWAGLGGTGLNWIPTQFVNDLGVTYTVPSNRLTFALDAKNIADRQVFDNFKIQRPGRAFYGKVTYNIF